MTANESQTKDEEAPSNVFRGESLRTGEEDLEKSLVNKGDGTGQVTNPIKPIGSEEESVTALLLTNSNTGSHERHPRHSASEQEKVNFMLKAHGINEDDYIESKNSHEDDREQVLSEDIYSVIYTAPTMSQAFWFAIFVFLLQLGLLAFISYDLLDWSSDNNKLRLPPGVPEVVTIAQSFGVLLIVFTVAVFGDLTKGMARLIDGFDKDVLTSHPNVTCAKWFFSGCFQMLVGCTMTLVLFILLMQSTTVVGMCLNFAALHFVQEIDDMSFLLGQKGFLTSSIQAECDRVSNLTVPRGRARVRKWARHAFIVLLTIGLFVPYFILLDLQLKGEYICGSLYIQFGDAYIPELAYFSGQYKLDFGGFSATSAKLESRPVYFDSTMHLRLAYCGDESAWTFSYANGTDHCDFYVKSSSTTTFDVVSLKDTTWYSKNEQTGSVVPADWFFLGCNDCKMDSSQCNSASGTCVNSVCECNPGRMGVNCQFADPTCEKLALDARTDPLPLEQGNSFPETYALYTGNQSSPIYDEEGMLEINFHPAYTSSVYTDPKSLKKDFDIMFFTGRRWVIFAPRKEQDMLSGADMNSTLTQALVKVIAKIFDEVPNRTGGKIDGNEFVKQYRAYFFSAPVDYGTPSDALEPIGLDWFRATQNPESGYIGFVPDDSQPLATNFICAQCDPITNPCYNDFTCDDEFFTKECSCDRFYEGALCEHPKRCDQEPCLNGGECDAWHGYCECVEPYYGNLCQFINTEPPTMAPTDSPTMATVDNTTLAPVNNTTMASADNSTMAAAENTTMAPAS